MVGRGSADGVTVIVQLIRGTGHTTVPYRCNATKSSDSGQRRLVDTEHYTLIIKGGRGTLITSHCLLMICYAFFYLVYIVIGMFIEIINREISRLSVFM